MDISRIKHLIELGYRAKLGRWIDAVVTFSDDRTIFGGCCINISNAANPQALPLSRGPQASGNALHFVAVADLAFWHGYDRLISSMGRHYRERTDAPDIHFHLVGGGADLDMLKVLAEKEGVSQHVKCYGALAGQDLDRVFDCAHIGVDSLGRHRSENFHNNSLKSKEYLMHGLPLIKSHLDRSIDDSDFHYQVAVEDQPFDLEAIAQWYRSSRFQRAAIRNYALANFTWTRQMRHVLDECAAETAY
ncbi:MAG: glycosyltransferase [Noviherbaspirillum sp.]